MALLQGCYLAERSDRIIQQVCTNLVQFTVFELFRKTSIQLWFLIGCFCPLPELEGMS